jgi:hypothetical protein
LILEFWGEVVNMAVYMWMKPHSRLFGNWQIDANIWLWRGH